MAYPVQREFIITANSSFWRQEVTHYIQNDLAAYTPTKTKLVLVPCAADKDYPSPLHKAVMERMPEDYYIANATGVLGIVPQDLWPVMPHYDSGIPNEWRLLHVFLSYFSQHPHTEIVVYADFYNIAMHCAFRMLGMLDRVTFVHPVVFYSDYLDLLAPENLAKLDAVFANLDAQRPVNNVNAGEGI